MAKTVQKGGYQEIHERHGHISLKILISLLEAAGRKIPDSLYCEALNKEKVINRLPKIIEEYSRLTDVKQD
jgi:hypothetical protein